MSRNRGYMGHRRLHQIVEPREEVPRTEHEETRRAARDWLRERDESNTTEFEDYGGSFDGFSVTSDADSGL